MYFILDSNIYCSDFFGQSAPFRYLIHFINNEGHTLLLPRVVIEEVANVRARKIAEEVESIRKALASLRRMGDGNVSDISDEVSTEAFNLLSLMSSRVEDVELVEYRPVDHRIVLERALHVRRPFRPGEKGYRDTMLWLSLLEHLKSKPNGTQVVFINGNKNDFFADSQETEFHKDLRTDLLSLTNIEVRPFLSITAFVGTEIDKNVHAIDRVKLQPVFEEYLEEQALIFFNSTNPSFLHDLCEVTLPRTNVFEHALAVNASLMEGVEDFEITATSELEHGDVYVSCEHDLRIVVFEIVIPRTIYESQKWAIETSRAIYEVEEKQREVVLETTARAYLSTSFSFNRESATCDGYAVDMITFR